MQKTSVLFEATCNTTNDMQLITYLKSESAKLC